MRWKRGRAALAGPLALGMSFLWLAAECTPAAASPLPACTQDGRTLEFGFYAHFEPVSYSAAAEPGSPGFDSHRGYESDLLDALEAMGGAGLGFSRRGSRTGTASGCFRPVRVSTSSAAASRSWTRVPATPREGRRSSSPRVISRFVNLFWCAPKTPGGWPGTGT